MTAPVHRARLETSMVVVVFRARLRKGVDMTRLESTGARMYELASSMPGFVSYKDYAAPDGESLTLIEFETEDAVLAWREHPEHRGVQEQGRQEFFSEYHIQVCAPLRDYRFSPSEGRRELPMGQRGGNAKL